MHIWILYGRSLSPSTAASRFACRGIPSWRENLKLKGSECMSIWFLGYGTSPTWTRNFLLNTFQRFSFQTSTNEEFAVKEAALLMNIFPIHVQAKTLQMLADHRVKVITFPPHTTYIFQCLVLSLFGDFKKKWTINCHWRAMNTQRDSSNGFSIWWNKQTWVENNVRSAFMQRGFQYNIEVTLYLLWESPGFTSL
jgi:hypothetical protein